MCAAVISARSMKLEIRSPGSTIVNNLRPTRSSSVSSAIDSVSISLFHEFLSIAFSFTEAPLIARV